MKIVMRAALALLLASVVVPSVFADGVQGGDVLGADSSPIKTITVSAPTSSVGDFAANSLILGFKLYANDAGDKCALYDAATFAGGTTSNVIDEWVEATDEETNVHIWPRPFKLVTDLSVDTNGVCVIYYQ